MDYNQQQIHAIAKIRQQEFLQEAARNRLQRRASHSETTRFNQLVRRIARLFRSPRHRHHVDMPRRKVARSI